MESLDTLKILFLEDVEDDAELVARALRKEGMKFNMKRVDSKDEFMSAVRSEAYDVILSDHSLPQFNSSEALRLCHRAGIHIPFILVTGTVSEEFAVRCLKQGADDYVLKSNLTRLSSSIVAALKQRKSEGDRRQAEQTLRHQNEELIKINQELDSFVYSVSHNLRAPLMSLLGLLNISRYDAHPRDPVYDQYFSMMENSIKKLDETLKEILDYSRNARNEIDMQPIRFEELIADNIDKLKYLDGSDDVHIDIEFSGKHITFFTDPHRLSVVFGNLLSNAIKYRDLKKDKCHLKILIRVSEERADMIFQDNGIGIADSLLPRIFNMFFRGTDKSEGAGLGLYIVKETITKLKGEVDVISVLGKGTTFRLWIPNQVSAESR
jgi:signal transduction histidine kinase